MLMLTTFGFLIRVFLSSLLLYAFMYFHSNKKDRLFFRKGKKRRLAGEKVFFFSHLRECVPKYYLHFPIVRFFLLFFLFISLSMLSCFLKVSSEQVIHVGCFDRYYRFWKTFQSMKTSSKFEVVLFDRRRIVNN